jgi:triacylglycerol lipase
VSPRRRAAIAGLLAVVLLGVLVLVLRQRAAAPAVAQDRPGTVLLVAGYGGSTSSLRTLQGALRAAGRTVEAVPVVGAGTGDLRTQAQELDRAARAALAAGAPSVDVVGYSAGGVVARVWAADLEGTARARRIVTLGSPHHGTDLASAGASVAAAACPEACRQLAVGSELLTSLPDAPAGPEWVSLWTSSDEVVTPPDSAVLSGAVDVELQAVCADARTSHGELTKDPLVVGLVARALAVAPLAAPPPPGDCAALRAAGAALLSS